MSFEQIANLPLVQALGWTLLHFLWQGTLIAGTAYLLLYNVSRQAADRRYAVLMFAFLAMTVAPMITWGVSYRSAHIANANRLLDSHSDRPSIEQLSRSESEEETNKADRDSRAKMSGSVDGPTADIADSNSESKVASEPNADSGPQAASQSYGAVEASSMKESQPSISAGLFSLTPTFLAIAAGCWAAGVFILGVRFLVSCLFLGRQVQGSRSVTNESIQSWFQEQCQRQGIKVWTRLMESKKVLVPLTIGWIRPIVVVPTSAMTGLSEEELKAIIIHELAHVRRWDYLVNLFQTIFEIVMFFHPAVWWLSQQIRAERENCCDDVAVSLSGKPKTYVNALAEIARNSSSDKVTLAPSAAGGELLYRIHRILSYSGTRKHADAAKENVQPIKSQTLANRLQHSVGGIVSLLFFALIVCGVYLATGLLSDNSSVNASNGPVIAEPPATESLDPKASPTATVATGTDDDDKMRNRIVDVNGKGIPNATIAITEYSYKATYETFGTTTSDANGYFDYPAETPEKRNFFVRVSAKGYFAQRWIGNHSVHKKREGRLVPDILKLGRSVAISGRVIGPGRKALGGIPLSIDYKTERVASINARQIVTDENGEFNVQDLPPGKIFVRYEWREKRKDPMPRPITFGIAYVNAGDGESVKGMNLDFSKPLATIRGKVLDRDGKPMKNAEVVARWATVLVNLDHTVRSKTDADGNYEFKGLLPGSYLLGGGRRFPIGTSRPQVVMAGQTLDYNIESFVRGSKPPADRKKLNWSKGDLQYALMLDPVKENYQLRDKIKVNLLVRNSSETVKDFEHTFSFNRLHIGNDDGFYRALDYRFFTGIPRVEKFKLDPGHEVLLGAFSLQITHPKDTGSAEATFGVQLEPEKYNITMSIGNGFGSERLDKIPTDAEILDIRKSYVPKLEFTVIDPPKSSDEKDSGSAEKKQ